MLLRAKHDELIVSDAKFDLLLADNVAERRHLAETSEQLLHLATSYWLNVHKLWREKDVGAFKADVEALRSSTNKALLHLSLGKPTLSQITADWTHDVQSEMTAKMPGCLAKRAAATLTPRHGL